MIIIVTGSRDWTDKRAIKLALDECVRDSPPRHLFEGGAKGLDILAREVANDYIWLIDVHTVRADWAKHGKAAGPIRNTEMLKAALELQERTLYPIRCLAFPLPQSVGTWDMIRKAVAAGVRTTIYPGGQG